MAHAYLKEPIDQHKDIKIPLKVLFVKDDKAMVHSNLTDKTFEIDATLLFFKANDPILEHSEYVVDVPEKRIRLGEKPIFPSKEDGNIPTYGISKRLYIATAALQGLLSNSVYLDNIRRDKKAKIVADVVAHAFIYSDAVLKQENE